MLSATSFQITLLTGRNWQDDVQLYVLGGVFLAASAVWYPLFRLKPSVYVLSAPWIFFGLAFFMIGLPSVSVALLPAHRALASAATWCYAVASAAAFLFFGLNFGEEAVRIRKSPKFMQYADFVNEGCCHGGLDSASLRRTRLATNLGRGFMVLGQSAQWKDRRLCTSVVDLSHRLALGGHEFPVCVSDVVRSSR